MSSDYNIYMGIYFECEKHYEETREDKLICSKCNIDYTYKDVGYCPKCGSKIEEKINFIKQEKTYEEEFEEAIISLSCFGNNIKRDKTIYILNSTEYYILINKQLVFELNSEFINTRINNFKEDHPEIIEMLRKYYKDNFEIKFGITTYYV